MRSNFALVAMPTGKALTFAIAVVVIIVLFGVLLTAKPAHAKTFTVNSTQDFTDIDPGDGVCDTISSPLLNPCTLRGAIQEANAFSGADTINFNIPDDPSVPGKEVKSIKLALSLPEITRRVTINGYTQPGASPNTLTKGTDAKLKIELDGTETGPFAAGLRIGSNASNTVIKGLVINRLGSEGILCIGNATGIRVEGNFIGTDPSGTLDRGNGTVGVSFSSASNTVGGSLPAVRNVISGNAIGVAIASSDNKVVGNLIGTSKDGTSPLGNDLFGVRIFGDNNTVGGATSGAANTIAFNGDDGVMVFDSDSTGNRILRNSIHSNLLGIDLVGGTESISGQTANDPQDTDTGPNGLQNYPVITSATTSGGKTTIKGKLNSTPSKTFTVRFFSNPAPDPPEGKKFIGQKSVSTNANGNTGIFTFTPNKAVPVGLVVTATATGPGGNTSEFWLGKSVAQQQQ